MIYKMNSLVFLLIIFSPFVFTNDLQQDGSEVAGGEYDSEIGKSSLESDSTENTEDHDSKIEAGSYDVTNPESTSSASIESDEIKVIKSYANVSEARNDAEESNADVDIDVDSTEEEISEDIVKLMQVKA